MLRKLTVLLLAALFSVSVAGLSFAASHEKKAATPATPATPAKPAAKPADNPCATGAKEMGKKKAKKKTDALKAQKAECLKNATTDQAKAECEKKFAEKAKKKPAKKKMGEVPGPVEK
jgi:Spy/CpxP family protein refolding chaperone